jgi:protein-disulfide isomerase
VRIGALALGFAAVALVGAAPHAARKAAPAADWTKTVVGTADGGFRMGNPRARITIVEYGSLTCPHCRHFAETAMKPLLNQYVRTGKANYEYRSLVLNGIDIAATLVARCGGASHFFPVAQELYATQATWVGKIDDATAQTLDALPPDQQMLGVAKATGLLPIAAKHGIPSAKAEACLNDQAAADQLEQAAQSAGEKGVHGTPTFFVNGKRVAAGDWATLEPILKDAGS